MSSLNSVNLIGRLTQDPAVNPSTDTTRCRMRIAVQRRKGKNGEDKGANYFDVVAFGGQAVNCGKFLSKGRQIALTEHHAYRHATANPGRRPRSTPARPTQPFRTRRRPTTEDIERWQATLAADTDLIAKARPGTGLALRHDARARARRRPWPHHHPGPRRRASAHRTAAVPILAEARRGEDARDRRLTSSASATPRRRTL